MRRRVSLALCGGLTLLAIAVGVTLSRSPLVLARTNSVPEAAEIAPVTPGAQICQGGETLPRGSSAIRLAVNTGVGPSVDLRVRSGGRVIAHGTQRSGWRGASVTVELSPRIAASVANADVCAVFGPSSEPVELIGAHSAPGPPAMSEGSALVGRMQIEYLRPASGTWWSRAGGVAERMGFGRAFSGGWVLFFVLALSATIAALTSWIALRGLR